MNNIGLHKSSEEITDDEIAKTAEIILNGGVVGVCNNEAEAGPRALGNRSLIALANSKEIAKKVSVNIKKREWYRPIAPIMLSHNAEKVSQQPSNPLSKFMLLDFTIKKEYYSALEGVIPPGERLT